MLYIRDFTGEIRYSFNDVHSKEWNPLGGSPLLLACNSCSWALFFLGFSCLLLGMVIFSLLDLVCRHVAFSIHW